MFFRKKHQREQVDLQETAASIFGPDVVVGRNKAFSTGEDFPLRAEFAPHAECDYAVHGHYRGLEFDLCFPLKVYQTEREKRISHWAFLGSCITVRKDGFRIRNTVALTGKPFRRPNNGLGQKNDPVKRVAIWSDGERLSQTEFQVIEKLIIWIDREFSALCSPRYAVQVRNGTASIVFWEPDLYDAESQMKLLAEALQVIC